MMPLFMCVSRAARRRKPYRQKSGSRVDLVNFQAALQRMTVTQPLTARDVTWVLTVPVCCSEPAKHFMRQAAVQAGFIQGGHDDEVRYSDND